MPRIAPGSIQLLPLEVAEIASGLRSQRLRNMTEETGRRPDPQGHRYGRCAGSEISARLSGSFASSSGRRRGSSPGEHVAGRWSARWSGGAVLRKLRRQPGGEFKGRRRWIEYGGGSGDIRTALAAPAQITRRCPDPFAKRAEWSGRPPAPPANRDSPRRIGGSWNARAQARSYSSRLIHSSIARGAVYRAAKVTVGPPWRTLTCPRCFAVTCPTAHRTDQPNLIWIMEVGRSAIQCRPPRETRGHFNGKNSRDY